MIQNRSGFWHIGQDSKQGRQSWWNHQRQCREIQYKLHSKYITLKVTMAKKQLTDAWKGYALGQIEDSGWSNSDVGVSCWTIMGLIAIKHQNPESEVPARKRGTGPIKKYGKKEIGAIEQAMERNSFLSSTDLNIILKTLKNIDARTVRRILKYDLDRPASVAPVKPFLTDDMEVRWLDWLIRKFLAECHLYWRGHVWSKSRIGLKVGEETSSYPKEWPSVLQKKIRDASKDNGHCRNHSWWVNVFYFPQDW